MSRLWGIKMTNNDVLCYFDFFSPLKQKSKSSINAYT